MSSRPKPTKGATAKAPSKGATTVKAKPAAKGQTPTKSQPAGKKATTKTGPPAGGSKTVKEEAVAAPEEEKKPEVEEKKVSVKQLKTALLDDQDHSIHTLNKPVLLVDNSTQAARTFFTYTGETTLRDLRNPENVGHEQIRQGVLGCVRHGKVYVANMEDVAEGMYDELRKTFEKVEDGFFDSCCDRSVIKPEKYERLIRDSDGEMYGKYYFKEEDCEKFHLIILSNNKDHSPAFKEKFHCFSLEDA